MTEQNKNEITPLLEQINLNTLLDNYEYNPKLYSLEEIDCAELTANNVVESLREEMDYFIKTILAEHEQKLRQTDTMYIFNRICHHMWDKLDFVEKYYFDECEKTRKAILEQMECHEASKHFEDYMNEPECQTSDIVDDYDISIKMCQKKAHYKGECEKCTEVICPYSSVNEV